MLLYMVLRMGEDHLYYMGEALEEAALASREGEVPVGAVLVGGDGGILARTHNRCIALNDPTAHAEILAVRDGAGSLGNYRLEGTTLYVTVEPCVMCAGSLVWARVRRLVYGAADVKAGAVDSLYRITRDVRLNHSLEVVSGILEKECRELMKRFFEDLRTREAADPVRDKVKANRS
jgi:tRNA(adenine34) deaminase